MTEEFDTLVAEAEEPAINTDAREIEETLLLGLFTGPQMVARIIGQTRPTDFYFDLHRSFAGHIYPALAMGQHVDLITLRADLEAKEEEEAERILDFAAKVITQAHAAPPQAGKVEAYLGIFVGQAQRRAAHILIEKAGASLSKGKLSPEGAAAEAFRAIADLEASERITGATQTEGEDLEVFFADIEARQNPSNVYQGLNSGFTHMNNLLNGLMSGLFIVGAAPSTGKTTLLKQIADQVVEKNQDAACLFISLEQSKEELRIKTLSRLSGVENRDIMRGRLNPGDPDNAWAKVREAKVAFAKCADRMVILEGNRNTTPDRIRLAAIQLRQKTQAARLLIVIDYLQIVPVEGRFTDNRQKVDFVVSELRRIARDLQAPVLAISAIGRAAYDGTQGTMDAYKESGGIEFGADVAGVMIEDKKKENSDRTGTDRYLYTTRNYKKVFLDIVKNRNGERGRIELKFFPAVSAFVEGNKQSLPEE